MPSVGRTRNPPPFQRRKRSHHRAATSGRDVVYSIDWLRERSEQQIPAAKARYVLPDGQVATARGARDLGATLRMIAEHVGTTITRARELLRAGA